MTRAVFLAFVFCVLSYAAVGPLRILAPAPSAAQGETAAVQDRLDEDRKTLLNLVAAVERLEGQRPRQPATVTATELGCVPGDGKDDAPAIQAALDRMLNVEFDGSGLYEIGAPLRLTPGQSNVLSGGSAGYRHGAAGVTGLRAMNDGVTHLIEVPGDASKSTGQVQVIRNLYLEGTDKTDGIRVHGCDALRIESVCIRKCKTGIAIDPKIRCYAPALDGCAILGCDVGVSIKNGTSVCSFSATGCEILTGRLGITIDGWRRGAVFTGCVVEGQSELCLRLEDARCTMIGSYLENSGTRCWMKASNLVGIDSTCGNISHNATSTVDWLGANNRPYTVQFP